MGAATEEEQLQAETEEGMKSTTQMKAEGWTDALIDIAVQVCGRRRSMGAASRRGTYEERVAQAVARKEAELQAGREAELRRRIEHETRLLEDPVYADMHRRRQQARSTLAMIAGWGHR